ncbi:MAG: NahK/ErcS family hybrid sensor histidine kinase/response regulator [Magnetovibrionaceae bacterium]
MIDSLDLPEGTPDEAERLRKIVQALMKQVERSMDVRGGAFSLFQTAILLDSKVRARTGELEQALSELERANRELTRTEAEANRAKGRLSDAVESISEGFALFDEDDRLVLCNERFWDFWGDHRDEIPYCTPFAEVARKLIVEYEVPGGQDGLEAWLEERLQRHRHPGEAFVVQLHDGRWLKINERPTGEGGRVGIYTDITDIKQQETQRRERELAEKSVVLQASLDSLSQGVAVFDRDLALVAWNQRFVELLDLPDDMVRLGMTYEGYIRFNADRGEYGEDRDQAVARRLDRAKNRAPLFFEYTRPNGRVIELQRNPMPGGGFVTTYTDATLRREAAEQLREAKELLEHRVRERTDELKVAKDAAEEANLSKTRFLAAASHDLLQPLNAARLFISTLLELALADQPKDIAERADFALAGVEGLLSTLLEISKLDAGAVPVVVSDFALDDLLGRLEKEYKDFAVENGLDLTVVGCSAVVRSDAKLLSRVVRNFLSNAIRYTESGKVLLGCRRRRDGIEIGVWDTGPGISEDDKLRIFEEFRRLDNAGTHAKRGAGLGLAIVKRIARMLNHPLRVDSSPGRGACFTVLVPFGELTQAQADVLPATHSDNPFDGAVVAVIDNEAEIQIGMQVLLEAWGCDVLVGATHQEIVRAAAKKGQCPDLVLADYHLDDNETGIDALAQLEEACGKELPGIVITADASDEVRDAITEAGRGYLTKPVKVAKLRAWIAQQRG